MPDDNVLPTGLQPNQPQQPAPEQPTPAEPTTAPEVPQGDTPGVNVEAPAGQPVVPVTLDTNLTSDIRNTLSDLIKSLQAEADRRPAEGAEVTLAIRHLQDARMRLGVAEATAKGHDPWANTIPEVDEA